MQELPEFSNVGDYLLSVWSTNIICELTMSHYYAWFWRFKNKCFLPLRLFYKQEKQEWRKKGRASFLIRSEVTQFFFFVKDNIHIIVKLIIVSQPFYFTHKKTDAQRQIKFFKFIWFAVFRSRMKIFCFL